MTTKLSKKDQANKLKSTAPESISFDDIADHLARDMLPILEKYVTTNPI
jgi:hypothetical protein